ncbi:MAG: hypothetical protein U0R19_32840 [Bryobacteraceae bacterium]
MDNRKPPDTIYKGQLGDELMILSLPVIRTAEKIEHAEVRKTSDGKQSGEAGGFLVRSEEGVVFYIGERRFYGSYMILGNVGPKYICQRQLHVRRAWEVVGEDGVLFFYLNRPPIHLEERAWVYQSDDDDFGLIHARAMHDAHINLGTVEDFRQSGLAEDVYRTTWLIALLPPVLTLIAILAYTAAMQGHSAMSALLLSCEAILLTGAVVLISYARKHLWFFKAAMKSATRIAAEFQQAAQILGQTTCTMFPSMALWRAAQMEPPPLTFTSEEFHQLRERVIHTESQMAKQTHRHHKHESWGEWLVWITCALILACVGAAIYTHGPVFEVIAILLPSIVTAVHAYLARRQTLHRVDAGKAFLSELRFVKEQLNALARGPIVDPAKIDRDRFAAVLRVLCKAVAQHTQRELEFALREQPNLPL